MKRCHDEADLQETEIFCEKWSFSTCWPASDSISNLLEQIRAKSMIFVEENLQDRLISICQRLMILFWQFIWDQLCLWVPLIVFIFFSFSLTFTEFLFELDPEAAINQGWIGGQDNIHIAFCYSVAINHNLDVYLIWYDDCTETTQNGGGLTTWAHQFIPLTFHQTRGHTGRCDDTWKKDRKQDKTCDNESE